MIKTTTTEIMNLGIDSEDLLRYANEDPSTSSGPQEPRQHVIDALLRFSRSLEIKRSATIGTIEHVTN
ncbi:MAG: hypothetical protein HY064_05445 [Bacteroidetes bacterium]|nr:hypothetical protein [Bacteroidota bacterium]